MSLFFNNNIDDDSLFFPKTKSGIKDDNLLPSIIPSEIIVKATTCDAIVKNVEYKSASITAKIIGASKNIYIENDGKMVFKHEIDGNCSIKKDPDTNTIIILEARIVFKTIDDLSIIAVFLAHQCVSNLGIYVLAETGKHQEDNYVVSYIKYDFRRNYNIIEKGEKECNQNESYELASSLKNQNPNSTMILTNSDGSVSFVWVSKVLKAEPIIPPLSHKDKEEFNGIIKKLEQHKNLIENSISSSNIQNYNFENVFLRKERILKEITDCVEESAKYDQKLLEFEYEIELLKNDLNCIDEVESLSTQLENSNHSYQELVNKYNNEIVINKSLRYKIQEMEKELNSLESTKKNIEFSIRKSFASQLDPLKSSIKSETEKLTLLIETCKKQDDYFNETLNDLETRVEIKKNKIKSIVTEEQYKKTILEAIDHYHQNVKSYSEQLFYEISEHINNFETITGKDFIQLIQDHVNSISQ